MSLSKNSRQYVNARSSNGRTPGFGPVCGGSSPPRATKGCPNILFF